MSGETGRLWPGRPLLVDERYYLYNEAGAWKIYALDLVVFPREKENKPVKNWLHVPKKEE